MKCYQRKCCIVLFLWRTVVLLGILLLNFLIWNQIVFLEWYNFYAMIIYYCYYYTPIKDKAPYTHIYQFKWKRRYLTETAITYIDQTQLLMSICCWYLYNSFCSIFFVHKSCFCNNNLSVRKGKKKRISVFGKIFLLWL